METDYRHIVAAVDLDDCAREVLRQAKWVATLREVPLWVLHVEHRQVCALCEGAEHALLGDYPQCAAVLQHLQALVDEAELPRSCLQVRVGHPATSIHAFLEQRPGSLLVLGAPRRRLLRRWVGSASISLLRDSGQDMMVVQQRH